MQHTEALMIHFTGMLFDANTLIHCRAVQEESPLGQS